MTVTERQRQRITRIIEKAIIRHGGDETQIEGSLDDMEQILTVLGIDPAPAPRPIGAAGPVPEGYHVITTDNGRKVSPMSQSEYDSWKRGDKTSYGPLVIVPKRDFGDGFYDHTSRTHITEGWTVVYGEGTYKGAAALPGGTWGHTRNEAHMMADILLFVGIEGTSQEATKFWNLLRAMQRATGRIN